MNILKNLLNFSRKPSFSFTNAEMETWVSCN